MLGWRVVLGMLESFNVALITFIKLYMHWHKFSNVWFTSLDVFSRDAKNLFCLWTFFARMRFNFSWLFLAKSKNTLEIIIETVTLTKAECVWIVPGLTGLKCRYLMILSEMSSHLQFMRHVYLLCVTRMEKSCDGMDKYVHTCEHRSV